MGVHFISGELISDTVIDALRPEALMFAPGASGEMRLVGIEYIIFQEAWDAENASPPTLLDPEGDAAHLRGSTDDLDWTARQLIALPFDVDVLGPPSLGTALTAVVARLALRHGGNAPARHAS